MRVLLWDFDGTLGYRQGMWSQALLDVLREHHPRCPATQEEIRPFLREGFPWHQPHIPHLEWETPEHWWREIEAVLMRAYVGIGCSFPVAKYLALVAFSSALTGYEKPHPQAFFQALDRLGCPETVWMIGDNLEADVLGAQAVGIPAILVRKVDERATYAFPDLSFISSWLSEQ